MNIIQPNNGGWLTQSSLKEQETRIFSKMVINPTSEWMEVDDNFKAQWEEEHSPKETEEM